MLSNMVVRSEACGTVTVGVSFELNADPTDSCSLSKLLSPLSPASTSVHPSRSWLRSRQVSTPRCLKGGHSLSHIPGCRPTATLPSPQHILPSTLPSPQHILPSTHPALNTAQPSTQRSELPRNSETSYSRVRRNSAVKQGLECSAVAATTKMVLHSSHSHVTLNHSSHNYASCL